MTEHTEPSATPNPIALIIAKPITAKPRADELLEDARTFPAVLPNSETVGNAAQLVKMLRTARKRLESERKLISDPINAGLKQLKARFDAVIDPMEKAEKWLNAKITAFQVEEKRLAGVAAERARKEQEEALLAEAVKLEESDDAEAADEVMEYAEDAPAPIVAEEKIIRGDYGAATSLRMDWVHEVEDLSKVPMEYVMLNDRVIRAAIKAAEKGQDGKPMLEIPGLKIIKIQTSVVR